jgi:hypothetical protein
MENKNLKERIGDAVMSAITFIVGTFLVITISVFVVQMVKALFD